MRESEISKSEKIQETNLIFDVSNIKLIFFHTNCISAIVSKKSLSFKQVEKKTEESEIRKSEKIQETNLIFNILNIKSDFQFFISEILLQHHLMSSSFKQADKKIKKSEIKQSEKNSKNKS